MELRCGMIALGTRGLGPMAGLLRGSVAQGVLQQVRSPATNPAITAKLTRRYAGAVRRARWRR